ncbi:unnamed protein product [Lampetra fluviatilis]
MSTGVDSAEHAGPGPADGELNLPRSVWIREQRLDDSLISLRDRADSSRATSCKDGSCQAAFREGLLMWKDDLLGHWRLVVPVTLRHELIRALHAEKLLHLGVQKTLLTMQRPGMTADIAKAIQTCPECYTYNVYLSTVLPRCYVCSGVGHAHANCMSKPKGKNVQPATSVTQQQQPPQPQQRRQ